MSERALAALRAGLGDAAPPAPMQSAGPAPTMALSDIATALTALQIEVSNATVNGATLADGITWSKIKSDVTSQDSGVFALAIQVQDWFYQVQAMQTWQAQAQAYIASLEAQHQADQATIAACEARAGTPSQPDTVVAAIGVGAVALGGIVGFAAGRNRELGGKWPWTW